MLPSRWHGSPRDNNMKGWPETLWAGFPLWVYPLGIPRECFPFGGASSFFGHINAVTSIHSGKAPVRQDPSFQGGGLGHHH